MTQNSSIFLTGASGFIGGKLSQQLLKNGRHLKVLSRRPLPSLEKLGAEVVIGDLDNFDAIKYGCKGTGTVFHLAGHVRMFGATEDFEKINVTGTKNMLAIAKPAGVARFIYTSSPSVAFDRNGLSGVDESTPICQSAPSGYAVSKAKAERLVQAAHTELFKTISLRPHLVWGLEDKNIIPKILSLSKNNRLKIVGNGLNIVDCTHIDNVVDAHLLAESALVKKAVACQRAYFITNGEPVLLWEWINELLVGLGRPAIHRKIPLQVAYSLGATLEAVWRTAHMKGEPPMTRFLAHALGTNHYFDIRAATRDLCYEPRIKMKEGTTALIAQYVEQINEI